MFELPGIKAGNSNKDGLLSEEEFNLWNRLYRLGDSDTVKGVALPRSHFLSLQEDRVVSWLCEVAVCGACTVDLTAVTQAYDWNVNSLKVVVHLKGNHHTKVKPLRPPFSFAFT